MKGFAQRSFDSCFAFASTAEIENIPIRFLHIDHLIEEKKLLAREKDISDVAALEKIRELTQPG